MTDCKNCPYTDEYCASGDCERDNDLTEQFDNDEIPKGNYYCKSKLDGHECIAGFVSNKGLFDCDYNGTLNKGYWEVLAPVPSYEEWKASYNCMLENEVLRLKNAQLKELLKECKEVIKKVDTYCGNSD